MWPEVTKHEIVAEGSRHRFITLETRFFTWKSLSLASQLLRQKEADMKGKSKAAATYLNTITLTFGKPISQSRTM